MSQYTNYLEGTNDQKSFENVLDGLQKECENLDFIVFEIKYQLHKNRDLYRKSFSHLNEEDDKKIVDVSLSNILVSNSQIEG